MLKNISLNKIILLLTFLVVKIIIAQEDNLYEETTLRTLNLTFNQPDFWQQLIDNKEQEIYISADLEVDSVIYPNVGVRFRGNSSYFGIGESLKKPFKIKLDEFVPGQELYGYETINLNNAFRDPTFLRETLSYSIFRDYMPAPKANYILLTINGENWGVYVNVQQINKDFLREWFLDDDGNRYKAAMAHTDASALTWLGSNPETYMEAYELMTEDNSNLWEDLIFLCDVLNFSNLQGLESSLNEIFNVDRALWMLALDDALPSLDSYLGTSWNYVLFHDDYHNRMQVLPWDFNDSFGGYSGSLSIGEIYQLSPYFSDPATNQPLMERLIMQTDARHAYLAHLRTILDQWLSWDTIGPLALQYQDLIRESVYADNLKLYSDEVFENNLYEDVEIPTLNNIIHVAGIQPMINNREEYLSNHPHIDQVGAEFGIVTTQPLEPTAIDPVQVTANLSVSPSVETVNLRWRLNGAFQEIPMMDDGQHGDENPSDGIWGAEILPQPTGSRVEFCIVAVSEGTGPIDQVLTFSPPTAEHRPYFYEVQGAPSTLPLRINEFLAVNDTCCPDEMGEYDDWIEIFNVGSDPINIGGMYITDDLSDPTAWQIPSTTPDSTTIDPGEFLLLWADNNSEQGILHIEIKLSGNGEQIGLFESDGSSIIDSLSFGVQTANVSLGRIPDGGGSWSYFDDPSPGNTNNNCVIGDVNCDYEVNILDVVLTINSILNSEYNELADLNGDGTLNVLDIVQLVNIILGN